MAVFAEYDRRDALGLAAHYGDDATLFRISVQLEAAAPWRDRRPPR